MSEHTKRELSLTGLFAAFLFLQFTVLALGNRAGEGLLSTEGREQVYYALQVFVILGFLFHAAAEALIRPAQARRAAGIAVLSVFAVGTAVMLAADRGTRFYLAATAAVMLCLGCLGGAVYQRMSRETAAGAATARCMGLGYAAATALQYLLQLQWGSTPLLPVFQLAALVLLAYALLRRPEQRAAQQPEPAQPRRLAFACLIATALLLFTSFYNDYIHHLQIQTAYTDYNVYSWPRLMLIPCYLLFAVIGDRRQGKLVPVAALCIVLVTMLNSVLTGSRGTYRLNMCLFYCAIAASVSYYNLTFWRLAQGTRRPALWASMGRVLDSAMVLLTGAVNLSSLPSAAVLAINVAGLAAIILLMAIGGDFSLAVPPAPEIIASAPPRSAEDAIERMRERYALTRREADVLRELVLTEDKQTVIGERLSIRPRTVQSHVTVLYQKTGTSTRSGLTDLYRDVASE